MKNLTVLEWPSHSSNLNPIENLWEVLNCRIQKKDIKIKQELLQTIQEQLQQIPFDTLLRLIDSMHKN